MGQQVQVSTSIRDRQIYQTLQKLSKGVSDANIFIERASGTVNFADATASPGAPTLIETVTVNTGYVPLQEEKLSLRFGNVYNFSNTTLTGTVGAEAVRIAFNEDGELILIIELWTADNYSFTGLSADWVLLEIKP